MDYTKLPRELVYHDRHSLLDFNLSPNTLNGKIFKRMQELAMFKDMINGDDCALRCLNNAYYICTLMLNDFTARLRIKLYIDIALEKEKWKYTYDAQALTMGIVYILLKVSNAENGLINDLYNRFETFEWSNNGARFSFFNMIYNFSIEGCVLNPYEVSPRSVDEIMNSNECLKIFIGIDSDLLTEFVEKTCTYDDQRLRLINRTLELEKEKYGFFDARISDGYHTLYALKSKITGKPMPDKIPCDTHHLSPMPPALHNIVKPSVQSSSSNSSKVEELEKMVEKLKRNNKMQADEIAKLKSTIDYYEKQSPALEEDKWYRVSDDEILTGEEEFTLRERIVFFSTVLSLEHNKKYTIFQNLATFIAEMCGDNSQENIKRIAIFISKMTTPEAKSANAKAAKKVGSLLKLIIPEENRNDKKLVINKYVESMELNFPEKDEE